MDDDPQELPWTEEQWEAHLKRSEARAARFGELLETLKDDPDMDVKIDEEMGWNLTARRRQREAEDPEGAYDGDGGLFGGVRWPGEDDDEGGFDPRAEVPFADDDDDDEAATPFASKHGAIDAEPEEYEDDDEGDEDEPELMEFEDQDITGRDTAGADGEDEPTPFDDDDDDVKEIEAYAKSMTAAERIHKALKTELEKPADSGDEEIGEAFINAHIACAKIAGGHGMGYDDDVLCGNIVCNKIALAANKRCEEALLALRERKVIPAETIDPLLPDLLEARASIEQRIAELRSKVWWDKK
jgi:hypothetical protein